MRVLWATANLPDPDVGGGAGHEHQLLRWACERHDVTLLVGGLPPGEPLPRAVAEVGAVEVVLVGVRRGAVPSKPALLLRSLTGPPLEFWMAREKVAALGREVAARSADLVHVMWPETAPVALAAAPRGPTAFFPSDSFVRHEDRERSAATTGRQRLYRSLQRHQTVRWERRYREAGAVAVASSLDAAALGDLGVHASVLPVALDDEWFAPPTVARDPLLVAFVAALDYGPNRDGAAWLASEVWPLVQAERPQARLEVVGRRPAPELVAAVTAAGGAVRADVPDVRPHYWEAGTLVSPIRLGSGMRNKVLHGVACGAPLVATSVAVEGIDLRAPNQLLLGDDARALAAAVVASIDDPAAAAARAAAARPIADAHRAASVGPRLDALWDRARQGRISS